MAEKSEARLELEARAKELGVTFAANIGDETLAGRVQEAAEAAQDGNTQPGEGAKAAAGNGKEPHQAGGTAPPADSPERAQYEVLEHLRHDGTLYEPGGKPVELTEKQAKHLRPLGVIGAEVPR